VFVFFITNSMQFSPFTVHLSVLCFPDNVFGNIEWFCFIQGLLPLLVDRQIKLSNSTPSLHPHYRTSSLLRVDPPLCSASVLSPSRDFRLSFSLCIGTTGSRVPPWSLDQIHATSMPDTTWAVSRFPPDLSRKWRKPSVLMSPILFRHFVSGSLAFVSPILT
jgi:hypothetical protein